MLTVAFMGLYAVFIVYVYPLYPTVTRVFVLCMRLLSAKKKLHIKWLFLMIYVTCSVLWHTFFS